MRSLSQQSRSHRDQLTNVIPQTPISLAEPKPQKDNVIAKAPEIFKDFTEAITPRD
jgi:hypothetical protein